MFHFSDLLCLFWSLVLFRHKALVANRPDLRKYAIFGVLLSPCIADPGSKIVEYAHLNNISVNPLVGPSSIILSLMASGFNGQKFKFHGYIPIDKNDKEAYVKKMMLSIKEESETQIFIETPYRNQILLNELIRILDEKIRLCLAINLTSSKEKILCDSIKNWRLKKDIDIDKQLCIFLIN